MSPARPPSRPWTSCIAPPPLQRALCRVDRQELDTVAAAGRWRSSHRARRAWPREVSSDTGTSHLSGGRKPRHRAPAPFALPRADCRQPGHPDVICCDRHQTRSGRRDASDRDRDPHQCKCCIIRMSDSARRHQRSPEPKDTTIVPELDFSRRKRPDHRARSGLRRSEAIVTLRSYGDRCSAAEVNLSKHQLG